MFRGGGSGDAVSQIQQRLPPLRVGENGLGVLPVGDPEEPRPDDGIMGAIRSSYGVLGAIVEAMLGTQILWNLGSE